MSRSSRRVAVAVLAVLAAAGCARGAPGPAQAARIDLGRADVLTDERVGIALSGLEAGTPVTLVARRADDAGRAWLSSATFAVGPDGRVDVDRQAPESGTYAGADGMGPVRSMRLADGQAATPPVPVAADPAARIALTALQHGDVVATAGLVQRSAAPGVTREDVHTAGLVGVLYRPPGPGAHPGVVLLPGSDGGIPDYGLPGLLASRGYAVLALAYFGRPGLPPALSAVPLEYPERAFTWLRARPDVSDGPVGVIGLSRGGELALLLGATSPQVGAVVSYSGSGVTFAGLAGSSAAWTRDGRDVPYLPWAPDAAWVVRTTATQAVGEPFPAAGGTWPLMQAAGPAALERATIPVERIRGPVLMLAGASDRLWPSPRLLDVAQRRLDTGGYRFGHELHVYPDAGHFLIDAPYAVGQPPDVPTGFGLIAGGGTRDGNARAAADAWPRVLATLRAGLQGGGRR